MIDRVLQADEDGSDVATVRERMAQSAMDLLARDGYAATSFAEVLADAAAPRGSVYHHFPGGKDELIEAAIHLALNNATKALETLRGRTPAQIVDAFARGWRARLERDDGQSGCPIMAVSSGAADNERLRTEVRKAFASWQRVLAGLFVDAGTDPEVAAHLAGYLLAAYEGAVLLARAEGSLDRFDSVDTVIRSSALALVG